MQHITVAETQIRLKEGGPGLMLLDCREAMELEIASISGAKHIPMSQITQRIDELNADSEIIVFCHQGIRSQEVASFLEQNGFTHVKSMIGGIDAWSSEIDSEVPRY